MTSRRSQIQEDIYFRVLRLIERNPQMSQRELAEAVGISVGGVHYVLKALVQKGLVKAGRFATSSDKRRYAYLLTPKGARAKAKLTRSFLARKLAEYEALHDEIEAIRVDSGTERTVVEIVDRYQKLKLK